MGSIWDKLFDPHGLGPNIPNNSRSMSGETRQRATVFDALSEGEIEGLVNGDASVYLDGTPLVDTDVYKKINPIKTTASVSASSTTVTVAAGALDHIDTDSEAGDRTIRIQGAGKVGSSVFSATAGSNTVTASSSWFTSGMASASMSAEGAAVIEIAGAGPDGRPYVGFISRYISATEVNVHPQIETTVSGVNGHIDLVSVITAYNVGSNQVTITTAASTTVSSANATIGVPRVVGWQANTGAAGSTGQRNNWEGVGYSFRVGTKNQDSVGATFANIPNASYVHAPNTRLDQNATYDGTNGVSDTIITSTNLGLPNAAETDVVKYVIEMPQLFAISTKSGTEYNSWVEFTCDFEYTRDGSTYTSHRLTGDSNSTILNRSGGYEYFNDRSTQSAHDGFIIHKTKKPFQEEYEHNVEQFKPFTAWRLRFKRVNEPNKPQEHHDNMNEAFVKFVEAQITDKLSYPYTAYAAITYSAKDFKNPKRGYHIRGKKIQVPTNYLTREEVATDSALYTRDVSDGSTESTYQDWDGNFRGDKSTFAVGHVNHEKVYCNNPAWVFYDIITNKRYGLGEIVDPAYIDKYALYQIARYCDELVPDGKGGEEPRFTCNAYLKQKTEAYKVLKDLATVFRGMMYWMDGQMVTVQDRPKEPIYTFTPGNVIDGDFAYESTSTRIRANQIVVKWNDPDDQYQGKSHIVDDVDNIIDTGRIISKNMTAFGCTSEGQAHRIGKWKLITDKVETELCKFSTSMNAGFLRPGDIINIQDHNLDSVQFSGRIKAGTSTTVVTLDRAVTLAANTTYKLHLVYPTGGAYLEQDAATINSTAYVKGDLVLLDEDGGAIDTQAKAANVKDDSNNSVMLAWSENSRVETKTISTSAGTIAAGSNITVSSAFSSAPNAEVIWAISGTINNAEITGNPKQYRIMGIDDEGSGTFSIAAALYNDKKYDIVEKDYAIQVVDKKQIATRPTQDELVPRPASISFDLQRIPVDDSAADGTENLTPTYKVVVEWDNPVETRLSGNVVANSYVNETLGKTETGITLGAAATTSTGYGIIAKGTSEEEVIQWTAKSGNDITAVRGALRTTARAHDTGVSFTEMTSFESVYKHLSHFELEHNFNSPGGRAKKLVSVVVDGQRNSFELQGVRTGTYTARIRTVNTNGSVSQWRTLEKTLGTPQPTTSATNINNLGVGGTISSGITIDTSGNWDISSSPYTVVNLAGNEYSVTQATATHAQRRQSFSGMSDGETGYAVFDASLLASDPWKATQLQTDSTFHMGAGTVAGSFSWWREVGASNIGLALCSGTITTTANSSTVTGSGTSFTSDFSSGDLIRLGSTNDYAVNTAAWYGYVDTVASNTSLTVKGVVTKAFSGKYAYKQLWKPDFANDFILSKVIRNSSSSYTLNNYVTGPGADGSDGATGATGVSTKTIYQAAVLASKPSTPSASSGVPSGWSDSIPSLSGSELCWMSIGVRAAGGTNYTWGDVILNLLTKDNIPDFGLAKADIGLGNVPNTDMTNIGNATSGTLSTGRGGTGLTSISTLLNSNVDAEHVGLENVPNVDMRDMGNANAGTLAAARGGTGLNSVSTLLNSNTTASDVGLGNVPNVDMRDLGNATSGTLSVARGGTGLGSLATLLNTNVTTFTVDKAQVLIWSNLSDNLTPAATTYDWTVTWLNGAGTSLGTTVIRAAVNTSNNTSLLAMTTQSNGASATVSLGGAVSAGSFQVTTVTLNSVVCTLSAQIIDGSGWDFKSG